MTAKNELPEPAAHMYQSDLEKFKNAETFAQAYSVAVGNPDERSVPLFTLADMVSYAEAAMNDAVRYRKIRRGQHWSVIDGIGDTLRAEALDAAVDSVPDLPPNAELTGGPDAANKMDEA